MSGRTSRRPKTRVRNFCRRPVNRARRSRVQVANPRRVTRPVRMKTVSGRAVGSNWYRYANGNPVSFNDPFGLCPGSSNSSGILAPSTAYDPARDPFNPEFNGHAGLSDATGDFFVGAALEQLVFKPVLGLASRWLSSVFGKTESTAGEIVWPANRGFVAGEGGQASVLPGQVVDRYGSTGGSFLSPAGTAPELRSLAPGGALRPLNSFDVLKPFEAGAGRAAPAFGQPGGGLQFDLGTQTVQDLINAGVLKKR